MRQTFWLIAVLTVALYGTYGLAAREVSRTRLHLNYSDSVPLGLYRETASLAAESYAGFCLPESTLRNLSPADFEPLAGDCPGHFAPVLKRLFKATPEQRVTLSAQGFSIAGRTLGNTAPRSRTHSGAALSHYPFGTYCDGLWAVSNYNPDSFDSRYFGPIKSDQIRFYAVPFLTH